MNNKQIVIISFLFLLLSCSVAKVKHTESAPGFRLSNYKTFDYFKLEATGDTSANFEKNAALLRGAITKNLQAKGLRRSETQPELLINIGIVVDEKTQTRETTFREAPRYMGQRKYSWKSEEVEVGKYKEGTATVHLVDARTEEMVWQGVVQSIIPGNEKKIPASIEEGVNALFDKMDSGIDEDTK